MNPKRQVQKEKKHRKELSIMHGGEPIRRFILERKDGAKGVSVNLGGKSPEVPLRAQELWVGGGGGGGRVRAAQTYLPRSTVAR